MKKAASLEHVESKLYQMLHESDEKCRKYGENYINPLNIKLNLICHLLALLGAHHILHISRIKVNNLK
jgi:hypothetical protein